MAAIAHREPRAPGFPETGAADTGVAAQETQQPAILDRAKPDQPQAGPAFRTAIALPAREERAIRVVPAQQPQTSVPRAQRRSREAAEASAPARVQVTIGRIEIRAANPRPQPRPAPRPPAMSLDEYLANRGKS